MLEENDYIRTDLGEIAIVTSVAKETLQDIVGEVEGLDRQIGFCNTEPYVRGNIVKHSKNIIDLIEVGDYVNGYKVISIDINAPNDCKECIELDRNNTYEYQWISQNEIKQY